MLDPVLVSIPEAQKALGNIGRNSVYKLISSQKLEVVKIGRRTMVKTESIKTLAA